MKIQSKTLTRRIDGLPWQQINDELLTQGFSVTAPILNTLECESLKGLYSENELYRSTIDMKRYNFGKGTYRYFKYPMPETIQTLRERIYDKISASANLWAKRSKVSINYPDLFPEFAEKMRLQGQTRPTPLILKYQTGDYNCLHQDIMGELFFPYQAVFGLSESGTDYKGGQLIFTQQRPRMQTIPHLITIPKGAAVIFAASYHPVLGKRGFYRTVFRHGVGKVESGERYTLGVVFHDYAERQ